MNALRAYAITVVTASLAAAGCATSIVLAPTDLPAALRAPADQTAFVAALATGVQIYECAPKPDAASTWAWKFLAPEATLSDSSGRLLGKRYAGPTWEAVDGSTVVGEVKASDPGPDPAAIPWLLLAAKSSTGKGVFAEAKSVQR